MQSAQALDESLFFFINQKLSNPLFDWFMPFLNWNPIFIPSLIFLAASLIWKGGTRARIFLAVVVLVVALGDSLICNTIKKAVHRPRPFRQLAEVNIRGGKGDSGSMPSSHAANWFAATTTAWLFFRRSWRFMLPVEQPSASPASTMECTIQATFWQVRSSALVTRFLGCTCWTRSGDA